MREFIEEAKGEMQKYYGYYCIICRKKNIPINPFYDFKIEDFYDAKKLS